MKRAEKSRGFLQAVLLLCLFLLPAGGVQAKEASLYLRGQTAAAQGNGWSWNPSERTLTLYDLEVDDIELPAGSSITVLGHACVNNAVFSDGSLLLEGPGTLKAYELNAGNGAADRNLVILSGLYLLSGATAYDMQIKGGCVLAEADDGSAYGAFHINGTYRQSGGCVRIKNRGGGSALRCSNNGIWVTAGYLECNSRGAGENASAIWCDNGAVCNYGGVIKAVNEGSGLALTNANNRLKISNGVSIFRSNGSQAVLASPDPADDIFCWTELAAAGKGMSGGGDKSLLAGENVVIFARHAYADEKVRLGSGRYPEAAAGIYVYGSAAQLDLGGCPVTSGCYAETAGTGPIPVTGAYVSGEGTLVGYSDSVAAVNLQSLKNFSGTLVGVSSKYGIYFDSSGPKEVALENGELIGIGSLCGIVCAKKLLLRGGSLTAAGIAPAGENSITGLNASFSGAELSVEGGTGTLYSSGATAYSGSGPSLWSGEYCAAYHTAAGAVSQPGEAKWQKEKPEESMVNKTAADTAPAETRKEKNAEPKEGAFGGSFLLHLAILLFGGFCLFMITGFTVTYLQRRKRYMKKHRKTAESGKRRK